ncbi:MAG TPA: NAD(P)H-binding protein [Paenirhodobacter sp.]
MIVITAPTGDIGSQVLANLIDGEERIRVIARDPARLSQTVRDRVEVVTGSHSDPEVVMSAFEGADSVFWLVPADPRADSAEAAYVDFARPASAALVARGVKRVVGISALGRGWPRAAGYVTATLKMDDMIAATGVAYRALACGSLMENVLRQSALIRDTGAFHWPMPGGISAPTVATRDVAAVAARLLRDPQWTGVDSIPLLGPQDVTFTEMMATVSEVIGRPVAYHEMAMEDLRGMMLGQGASTGMAQAMVDMMTAKNEGMDSLIGRGASALDDTPTTFRQWCAAVLKPALKV